MLITSYYSGNSYSLFETSSSSDNILNNSFDYPGAVDSANFFFQCTFGYFILICHAELIFRAVV